jgi:hypothetical protein
MKRSLASVAVFACMLMCAQLAVAQEEGYTYRLDKGTSSQASSPLRKPHLPHRREHQHLHLRATASPRRGAVRRAAPCVFQSST